MQSTVECYFLCGFYGKVLTSGIGDVREINQFLQEVESHQQKFVGLEDSVLAVGSGRKWNMAEPAFQ